MTMRNTHTRTALGAAVGAALGMLLGNTVAPAFAGTAEGYAAYMRQDYQAAMREFRPLADRGDPAAQVAVGWLYDNGFGVTHDDAMAAHWYALAANQGCAMPQQYLGLMYAQGEGLPKDYAKAAKYFRLAADQGDPGGAYGLGVMYRDGYGLPVDLVEAYKWFTVAISSTAASAQGREALAARAALAGSLSSAQINRATELATQWKPPHLPSAAQLQRCSFGPAK